MKTTELGDATNDFGASFEYRIILSRGGRYEVRAVYYAEGRIVGWASEPARAIDYQDMLAIGEAWQRPPLAENRHGLLVPPSEAAEAAEDRAR
jgi:hypothetical protein